MTAKQTVAGTWLMSVLEQFEAQIMAINSLPDATWLLEASERNPTRPLQMQAVHRIWHQEAKLNGDPLLGIRVGLNLSLQAVNIIAWIAIHSPTLRKSQLSFKG
ncbi:hypothetical protein ACDW_45130 (plasmid) [Acidovorax sp. DW039]|uniref:AraC family transcriptional regulator ligand-binding domain-containing protein n=1 Tax=Acidovorax sp. DW039 TaxID=3095606 RepID=UPI0030878097|nr:hypothetical protein ACDW_45130 [Acidovorax sp. DW039]